MLNKNPISRKSSLQQLPYSNGPVYIQNSSANSSQDIDSLTYDVSTAINSSFTESIDSTLIENSYSTMIGLNPENSFAGEQNFNEANEKKYSSNREQYSKRSISLHASKSVSDLNVNNVKIKKIQLQILQQQQQQQQLYQQHVITQGYYHPPTYSQQYNSQQSYPPPQHLFTSHHSSQAIPYQATAPYPQQYSSSSQTIIHQPTPSPAVPYRQKSIQSRSSSNGEQISLYEENSFNDGIHPITKKANSLESLISDNSHLTSPKFYHTKKYSNKSDLSKKGSSSSSQSHKADQPMPPPPPTAFIKKNYSNINRLERKRSTEVEKNKYLKENEKDKENDINESSNAAGINENNSNNSKMSKSMNNSSNSVKVIKSILKKRSLKVMNDDTIGISDSNDDNNDCNNSNNNNNNNNNNDNNI